GHYIRELPTDEIAERILPYHVQADVVPEPITDADREVVHRATPLVQERIGLLSEAVGMMAFLFGDSVDVDPDAAAKHLGADQRPVIEAALAALVDLDDWSTGAIETALRAALVDGLGLKPKNAFGPVRVAVTACRCGKPQDRGVIGTAQTGRFGSAVVEQSALTMDAVGNPRNGGSSALAQGGAMVTAKATDNVTLIKRGFEAFNKADVKT